MKAIKLLLILAALFMTSFESFGQARVRTRYGRPFTTTVDKYSILNPPRIDWNDPIWDRMQPDVAALQFFATKIADAEKSINGMQIMKSQYETVTARTVIRDKIIVDTIVIVDNIEPGDAMSLSEYQRTRYYEPAMSRLIEIRNANLARLEIVKNRYQENMTLALVEQRKREISDSLYAVERERRAVEEQAMRERAIAEDRNRRMMGSYEFEFTEPAGPIQTKSFTNVKGARVTYEYYVGENGYEVRHGRFTETMTFNNHRYWLGLNSVGWVYLDGTETVTCHYQNGILHGQMTYRSNVDYDATFDNARSLNQTYNFDIYKGFLNGSFDFWYKDIHYVGQAFKGIIQGSCKYETRDGYHGSIESKPFSTERGTSVQVAIPTVDTGWHEIEMGFSIDLPSILCDIPAFRFPFINIQE